MASTKLEERMTKLEERQQYLISLVPVIITRIDEIKKLEDAGKTLNEMAEIMELDKRSIIGYYRMSLSIEAIKRMEAMGHPIEKMAAKHDIYEFYKIPQNASQIIEKWEFNKKVISKILEVLKDRPLSEDEYLWHLM